MKPHMLRIIASAAVAAVVVVLLSFQAGRQVGRSIEDAQSGAPVPRLPIDSRVNAQTTDLEKVLIANVAIVGFEQLYEVLRAASAEQRNKWAKRLDEMPWSPRKIAALTSYYKAFVQLDPVSAVASVDALSDVDTKMIAAEALVGAAPAQALGEVANVLIRLPRDRVSTRWRNYLQDTIEEWSSVDPRAVAQFFDDHPADELEDYAWALAYNWAQVDPNSARAWVEQQPLRDSGSEPFDSLVVGWFQNDRYGAQNYAIAHADNERFERAVQDVTIETYLISPEEARGFLDRLPNEKLKKAAIFEISRVTSDKREAEIKENERPPDVVADWIVGFPSEDWRGGTMGHVLEIWEAVDPQALTGWVNRFPPETRNQIIAEFCMSAAQTDSRLAVGLGFSITDPNLRESVLSKYAQSFGNKRAEALEGIEKSTLPSEQKKYLVKLLPQE